MVLTKDRPDVFKHALESVRSQDFTDYELVVVNAGTHRGTAEVIAWWQDTSGLVTVLERPRSRGITLCRQEVLTATAAEYVAILDDDDAWATPDKLSKQVAYLDSHPRAVLVGGGMEIVPPVGGSRDTLPINPVRMPPETDTDIRATFLIKNNFYASTVLFRRDAALRVGGFLWNMYETAEDYDLWLRLGLVGDLYNFQGVFAQYAQPRYSKDRFGHFMAKQLFLVRRHKNDYPKYWPARGLLLLRLLFRR